VSRGAALLVAAALAGGCAVGPEYERPKVETPERWRIDAGQAAELANARWWEQFGDPVLDGLIDAALRENLDLRAAAARVDQFLGQLAATRAQFYPQLGYGLDASRNRASRVGQPPLAAGADPYYSLYQGALTADWQIDLFGRVRRQSEAAQAQVYASEQGRRGVVLSLVAAVATSYVGLRALDRQLEISRATAQNYGATQRIFEQRYAGGAVSELELRQIESQYQQALAAIPSLELQVAAQENLISALLGRHPGPLARGRTFEELAVPRVPGDLPAALLERRPDILQAEQTLVATTANIGVARSLYFPTFSLTGLLGSVSTALDDFLSSAARTASVAAAASGPIFTFGAIGGQVDTAEAAQREALALYRATILQALRETNDALVGSVKRREEADAQARRAAALRSYAQLSRLRFDNGYAGYLEVLYAENELFAAELTAVRARAEQYAQVVAVYQAVGGGWVDEAAKLAPRPQLAEPPRAQGR
jgi:multidrug efflux system outer membrane protein